MNFSNQDAATIAQQQLYPPHYRCIRATVFIADIPDNTHVSINETHIKRFIDTVLDALARAYRSSFTDRLGAFHSPCRTSLIRAGKVTAFRENSDSEPTAVFTLMLVPDKNTTIEKFEAMCDLLISSGNGPDWPDCYDAVIGDQGGHTPADSLPSEPFRFSELLPLHRFAAATHLTYTAVNRMDDTAFGIIIGLTPTFFGRSPGILRHVMQGLYDVTKCRNMTGSMTNNGFTSANKCIGIRVGKFKNIFVFMIHADSLDRYRTFISQAINSRGEKTHFNLYNAKFNFTPFPSTDDAKETLASDLRKINRWYNISFTTFTRPLHFPLTDNMITALSNVPHLKAYAPLMLPPDCWEPRDNLYKLAFRTNGITRLHFKHPSNKFLPSEVLFSPTNDSQNDVETTNTPINPPRTTTLNDWLSSDNSDDSPPSSPLPKRDRSPSTERSTVEEPKTDDPVAPTPMDLETHSNSSTEYDPSQTQRPALFQDSQEILETKPSQPDSQEIQDTQRSQISSLAAALSQTSCSETQPIPSIPSSIAMDVTNDDTNPASATTSRGTRSLSHDTPSSVTNLDACDSIFSMLDITDDAAPFYDNIFHDYFENKHITIASATTALATFLTSHRATMTAERSALEAETDATTIDKQMIKNFHTMCPTQHFHPLFDHYLQTCNLSITQCLELTATWSNIHRTAFPLTSASTPNVTR